MPRSSTKRLALAFRLYTYSPLFGTLKNISPQKSANQKELKSNFKQ
jgi:hypothetical protein